MCHIIGVDQLDGHLDGNDQYLATPQFWQVCRQHQSQRRMILRWKVVIIHTPDSDFFFIAVYEGIAFRNWACWPWPCSWQDWVVVRNDKTRLPIKWLLLWSWGPLWRGVDDVHWRNSSIDVVHLISSFQIGLGYLITIWIIGGHQFNPSWAGI